MGPDTVEGALRSLYSEGRVLCPEDALNVECEGYGHNDVERLDYGDEEVFYLKRMDEESVERAAESYMILGSLGVDVPEVYSDSENGLLAVGSLGEDFRNLQYLLFSEEIMPEDIDDEEFIKAATYKFVVSDFDMYSENMMVSPMRNNELVPVDYEFAGCSDFEDYKSSFFALERFLKKDSLIEEVYEHACEMVRGLDVDQVRDMYVEELGIDEERADEYTRYFRQFPDCFKR